MADDRHCNAAVTREEAGSVMRRWLRYINKHAAMEGGVTDRQSVLVD